VAFLRSRHFVQEYNQVIIQLTKQVKETPAPIFRPFFLPYDTKKVAF
jgi:hypothetical protein